MQGQSGSWRRYRTEGEAADSLLLNQKQYIDNRDILKDDILKFIAQYDENIYQFEYYDKLDEAAGRILDVFQVSDEEIFKLVLDKNFEAEFYGQINNDVGVKR